MACLLLFRPGTLMAEIPLPAIAQNPTTRKNSIVRGVAPMRNALCFLLFGCLLAAFGCGKPTDAQQADPTKPATAGGGAGRDSFSPPASEASGVPGSGAEWLQALGSVEVVIENVRRSPLLPEAVPVASDSILLALQVKVTSHRDTMLPLVEPKRFTLDVGEGKLVSPRLRGRMEPSLERTYLKKGASVSGWITFDVPEGAKTLTLKADFERPPLSLPVPDPRTGKDS